MEFFGLFFALMLIALIIGSLREPIRRLVFPRRWDLFVSHRSTDKTVVVPVVSLLRQQGLRVWLDMTEISEERSRGDRFRYPISQGVQQSGLALLFTSEAFCESGYCKQEVAFLVKRLGSRPYRILEVRLDANRARETLGIPQESPVIDVPRHVASGDEELRHEVLARKITAWAWDARTR